MEILNLDKITLRDHEVKLNGKTYFIPGRITLGIMFEILENQQTIEQNGFSIDLFKQSLRTLYNVFVIRQPDLAFEDFMKEIDINQYSDLVQYITSLFSSEKKTEESQEKA
jgi:hypothetical protein